MKACASAIGSRTGTLVGPLIDRPAFASMQNALSETCAAGGTVFGGERSQFDGADEAYYVRPALVEIADQTGPAKHETFAHPIRYQIPRLRRGT